MFSMRARTLSGLSSFLIRSFGFSGSRWPSAHWPSPRALRGRAGGVCGVLLGAMAAFLRDSWARYDAHGHVEVRDINVRRVAGASCAPDKEMRAASESRTHCAADAAVVDVAAGHEAAVNGSGHVRKPLTAERCRPARSRL